MLKQHNKYEKKQEQADFRVNWLLSLRRFFDSFIWKRSIPVVPSAAGAKILIMISQLLVQLLKWRNLGDNHEMGNFGGKKFTLGANVPNGGDPEFWHPCTTSVRECP